MKYRQKKKFCSIGSRCWKCKCEETTAYGTFVACNLCDANFDPKDRKSLRIRGIWYGTVNVIIVDEPPRTDKDVEESKAWFNEVLEARKENTDETER